MDSVLASLITGLGVGLLAMFGNMYASKKASDRTGALVVYRIDQLEEKVDEHNKVVVRTFKLEEGQAVLCEQLKVANHRIEDLERAK